MPVNASETPILFQPIELRGVTARNRIVVSPMCQYSATMGVPNDWHRAHYSKFAVGGAGIVFTEAAAVSAEGRITHGCLGLWTDEQEAKLSEITAFLSAQGAQPAIQIAHAGRKASMQRPWHGNGPLTDSDFARNEHPWPIYAPSPAPMAHGWLTPSEMDQAKIEAVKQQFVDTAKRAVRAGFKIIEIHGAHGYLIHSFLSPISNHRADGYGGSLKARMRFALEVVEAVRDVIPEEMPLFFRMSTIDGTPDGWSLDESVILASALKLLDVDVIDCSSLGNSPFGATADPRPKGPGFQVPYASRVKKDADIMTQAVGLITDAAHANEILENGDADLIAIGREALYNPSWPAQAAVELGVDPAFTSWPEQYGWWLNRRAKAPKP